jgi:hypothetical protein
MTIETKLTCIEFANWLDKLQPPERVSVWSKDGQYKGLFTMDNEQLFEKFEQYMNKIKQPSYSQQNKLY